MENRPGAGGTLGALALKDARPDGYTLSQMPLNVFRMPAMVARPQWDPLRDFTWIIRMVGYMGGVVVRPDAPWRTCARSSTRPAPGPARSTTARPA